MVPPRAPKQTPQNSGSESLPATCKMSLAWAAIGRLLARVRPGAPGLQAALYETARHFCVAYENGNYDPTTNGEYRLLCRLAAMRVRTVFDVGANRGAWSREAASRLPEAEIHAFELVPQTYVRLAETAVSEPRIRPNPFGLSDEDGTIQADAAKGNTELSSLLLVSDLWRGESWATVEAEVRRGDAYCAEHGIEVIDLLKIDVEGAEWRVLDGFGSMLDAGRIGMLQFEYSLISIVLAHRSLLDFWRRLEALGFTIGKLMPEGVDFGPYDFHREARWANIVAVHEGRPDMLRTVSAPSRLPSVKSARK
jgi:FkbM family methyltransferase